MFSSLADMLCRESNNYESINESTTGNNDNNKSPDLQLWTHILAFIGCLISPVKTWEPSAVPLHITRVATLTHVLGQLSRGLCYGDSETTAGLNAFPRAHSQILHTQLWKKCSEQKSQGKYRLNLKLLHNQDRLNWAFRTIGIGEQPIYHP
jgi:hypothetical protein